MSELLKDKDLNKFLVKINLLEYIQKYSPCSAQEVNKSFQISESELYRKLERWTKRNLIIKDDRNKKGKYYAHFTIIKQPLLKTELLNLYNELVDYFSKKYKEIASIREIIKVKTEKFKIKSMY